MKNLLKNTTIVITTLLLTFGTGYNIAEAAPSCNLTATGDDIIVNFSGAILFSSAQPHTTSRNANIPAGEYNITASTWDNHAAHGGQGQTAEKVRFQFKDGTLITKTSATKDIAEGSNWRTTNLGKYTISRDATKVTAVHAAIGTGNYQSVTPICIKLSPTSNPPANDLQVSCDASPSIAAKNETVTWDADATGGNGSYSYSWSGDTNGSSETVTKSYSSSGTKNATVTVTSGNQTKTASCSVKIEDDNNNNDLDVVCRASDTRIDEGDRVTFTADVSGGDSPFDYDWSGDHEGEDRNDDQISVRYDNEGDYRVRVTVTDDDGNTKTDYCPVIVVDEEDQEDDFDIQCKVDDTTVREGERVRFEVDIDGGDSPFEINWSGDTEGEDEDDEDSFTVRYDRDGRYEVDVRVEDDDGRVRRDSCPVVRVSEDDNDDNNINIITTTSGGTPTGNFASLSSVYLSQVPYTGPEEILKGIGFVLGLLIFSTLTAYMLRNKRRKNTVAKHISNFKESNKKAESIA